MTQSTPKKPASKARMSRKQPPDAKPGKRVVDPKEAYTAEQLAEVGAIVLMWNQIETHLDWIVYNVLHPPIEVMWDTVRRISGVRAKLELLRLYAERSDILNDDANQAIKITRDGISEYK
jgi:hypothetical protein